MCVCVPLYIYIYIYIYTYELSLTDRLREHLQRHAALAKVLREKEEKKSRFGKWKFGKKKKHRQVVRETENVPVEDDTVGSLIGDSCVESLRSAEM